MEKSLRRKSTFWLDNEKKPVFLREVSDQVIEHESLLDCADFLGLPAAMVSQYANCSRKIIKSKKDGKTYVISTSNKIMSK